MRGRRGQMSLNTSAFTPPSGGTGACTEKRTKEWKNKNRHTCIKRKRLLGEAARRESTKLLLQLTVDSIIFACELRGGISTGTSWEKNRQSSSRNVNNSFFPTLFFPLSWADAASHHRNPPSGLRQPSSPGTLATPVPMSRHPAPSWHRLRSWTWPLTPSSPRSCRRHRLRSFRHTSGPPRPLQKTPPPGRPPRSCSCCCSHLRRLRGRCTWIILHVDYCARGLFLWLFPVCSVLANGSHTLPSLHPKQCNKQKLLNPCLVYAPKSFCDLKKRSCFPMCCQGNHCYPVFSHFSATL